MSKADIVYEIKQYSNKIDAEFLQRFFKTGPSEYGDGDMFLGVRMPILRKLAKENFKKTSLQEIKSMLQNVYHEIRMTAVLLLMYKFKEANDKEQKDIYDIYIDEAGKAINNWDLVDITAPHIVGCFLCNRRRDDLYLLATGDLWQKRISIISTFWFIKNNDFNDSIKLAEILLYEEHDLLHKAVGWVLREIGKNDDYLLNEFLNRYAATMPRTTLRYALEKIPKDQRIYYMNLKNQINLT